MNTIILALISSFGCMFLGWRYFVAGENAKAAIRATLSQIIVVAVAAAVLFSVGELIVRVMAGGF